MPRQTGSNFPMDVLRQMVIASGKAGQEGTLKYMKSILDFYQNTYRVIAPPLNPFEFMSGQTSERRGSSPSSRAAATDHAAKTPVLDLQPRPTPKKLWK